MNLDGLTRLFARAGAKALYAKLLAENDNSKNQVYFSGAVETLSVFPSERIVAENSRSSSSFKAMLRFGWLLESGDVAKAPHAQLILYPQYPEVRFSGFLLGCSAAPSDLMVARPKGRERTPAERRRLVGRVLFLGVTSNKQVLGFVAAGDSAIAREFQNRDFPAALTVFRSVPLPESIGAEESRQCLLTELRRINSLGWIDSKQLGANLEIRECNAPQCGGFTLEAELGIPKNSDAEPDFLGWEIKQHGVSNLGRIEAGTITLMTPEPTGGIYRDQGVEFFVRKFGYPDMRGRIDRLNFGGIHKAGDRHSTTGLTMQLQGFEQSSGQITDATGCVALVSDSGDIAASWDFAGLFEHWARKHAKAAYVPSICRKEPKRQYQYGGLVRLAEGTDSLRLLKALAVGAVFYDPGIKVENASTDPKIKRRSQFRIASKSISALYAKVAAVEL